MSHFPDAQRSGWQSAFSTGMAKGKHLGSILCTSFLLLAFLSSIANAQPGKTTRVSLASNGTEANNRSEDAAFSADGRIVAFSSTASNLVENDNNAREDIFVHDRVTGVTSRVSVSSNGQEADGLSRFPDISADGRIVTFMSRATNLVDDDTNGVDDVFVHDRSTGTTTRVSVTSQGDQVRGNFDQLALSSDGNVIAFRSTANTLVESDTFNSFDIFFHDRMSGETKRISEGPNGEQADANSARPAVSADGSFIAFESAATNLIADDQNARSDVFVYVRETGAVERVSVSGDGTEGDGSSTGAAISGDGRYVVFRSQSQNLVAGVSNFQQIYLRDRQTGDTSLASKNADGAEANAFVGDQVDISADGRYVAFISRSTNLVPNPINNNVDKLFIHDLETGETVRASDSTEAEPANSSVAAPSLSAGGDFVAFHSSASNLVTNDTNGALDVFVKVLQDKVFQDRFEQAGTLTAQAGQ